MLTIPNRTPSDNGSKAYLSINEDKTPLTAKTQIILAVMARQRSMQGIADTAMYVTWP